MSEELVRQTVWAAVHQNATPVALILQRSDDVGLVLEAELPADYVLGDGVGLIRLESSELARAVQAQTLKPRVMELARVFKRVAVIVEGDLPGSDAVRAALVWMALEIGVATLHTRNAAETARYIELMATGMP